MLFPTGKDPLLTDRDRMLWFLREYLQRAMGILVLTAVSGVAFGFASMPCVLDAWAAVLFGLGPMDPSDIMRLHHTLTAVPLFTLLLFACGPTLSAGECLPAIFIPVSRGNILRSRWYCSVVIPSFVVFGSVLVGMLAASVAFGNPVENLRQIPYFTLVNVALCCLSWLVAIDILNSEFAVLVTGSRCNSLFWTLVTFLRVLPAAGVVFLGFTLTAKIILNTLHAQILFPVAIFLVTLQALQSRGRRPVFREEMKVSKTQKTEVDFLSALFPVFLALDAKSHLRLAMLHFSGVISLFFVGVLADKAFPPSGKTDQEVYAMLALMGSVFVLCHSQMVVSWGSANLFRILLPVSRKRLAFLASVPPLYPLLSGIVVGLLAWPDSLWRHDTSSTAFMIGLFFLGKGLVTFGVLQNKPVLSKLATLGMVAILWFLVPVGDLRLWSAIFTGVVGVVVEYQARMKAPAIKVRSPAAFVRRHA
jgi:hypothetical protein